MQDTYANAADTSAPPISPDQMRDKIREAFVATREFALETSKKVDPDTAELYTDWAESLSEAAALWSEDLEGPTQPTCSGMIERAIDATILAEASAPVGAEKQSNGGLVMQWLGVLKAVDPGAFRRKPKTPVDLARRIALELVLPDNPDRRAGALGVPEEVVSEMGQRLDSAAALIVLNVAQGVTQTMEDTGRSALRTITAIPAPMSVTKVREILKACVGGAKPATPKPTSAPKPTAAKKKPALKKAREVVARSKDRRVVVPMGGDEETAEEETPSVESLDALPSTGEPLVAALGKLGAVLIEGLTVTDALTKTRRGRGLQWSLLFTARGR